MKKNLLPIIGLTVVGLLLCVDPGAFRLARLARQPKRGDVIDLAELHGFSPSERQLLRFVGRNELDKLPRFRAAEMLRRAFPGDRAAAMFCANDLTHDIGRAFFRRGDRAGAERYYRALQDVLAELRRLDPDNGVPDLLAATAEAVLAVRLDRSDPKHVRFVLAEPDRLPKIAAFCRAALSKPRADHYFLEIPRRAAALLPETLENAVRRRQLADLFQSRDRIPGGAEDFLAWLLPCCAEALAREGRMAECREFVRFWPAIAELTRADLATVLIAYQRAHANSNWTREMRRLEPQVGPVPALGMDPGWSRETALRNLRLIAERGGLLSRMRVPASGRVPLVPAELAPERYISYLTLDKFALAGFAASLLLAMLLRALAAVRVKDPTPAFSRAVWVRIAGYGMALPLAAWIVFSQIDLLSGRDWSIRYNLVRFGIGAGALLFLWLPTACIAHIEARKAGVRFAAASRMTLLPLAVMLCLTGAVLRPMLDLETRYYFKRDTLFRTSSGLPLTEERAAAEIRKRLAPPAAKKASPTKP